MKLSKPLSALILIASGLLLSVGRNVNGASSKPRSNQSKESTAKHSDAAQQYQTEIEVLSSALHAEQATLLEAIRSVRKQAEAQRQQAAANEETYSSPSVRVQIGLLIVGSLYSLFACWQLITIRQQSKILNAALKADRPFIWVRKVEIGHDPPIDGQLKELEEAVDYANCFIQNLGKRAAIIVEVLARLKFSEQPLPPPNDFGDCRKVRILQPIVSETEPTSFIVRLGQVMQPQDVAKLIDPDAPERFACYGIIRYRDPSGDSYESTFGFHCQRISDDRVHFRWEFVRGADKYNQNT